MKIDRMLEIIIYLLNHENVSARFLAERFHVSVRTVQRDMVSISMAGIPVYSNGGKHGGYSILPTYQMKNSDIRAEEQQMIMKALESLATSYSNDTLQSILEKYNAFVEKEGGQKIFWDFGVTKENQKVQKMNTDLEKAIEEKRYVNFDYRNANGERSSQRVEPLAIHYKWYAWYLFAYVPVKGEYRTFKIARMQNLKTEQTTSIEEHGDIEQLMQDSEQAYYSTCIHIDVRLAKEESGLMEEYFPDCPIEKVSDEECRIYTDAPAGYHPLDVLPTCKSVISFACRFPATALSCKTAVPYTRVRNSLTPKMDAIALDFLHRDGEKWHSSDTHTY